MQSEKNSWLFIRCGSSTLTPAQKCYSTYDLELLGIVFALKSLHSFFSSGLRFTVLTDCAAVNNIQEVDISIINSNRILRADFHSRTAVGKPVMPEVQKFITPAPAVATLNLIYDGKVLDLQLDSNAKTGGQEAG